jgi:hypothetical protein
MNLKLKVVDAGNAEKERLVLTATGKDDISAYAVFRCNSAGDDKVYSGDIPNVYWFSELKVSEGDLVVLYTKSGTTSEKKNKSGTTSTFYYWGLERPIWTPGMTPVVVHAPEWMLGAAIERDGATSTKQR